MLSKRVLQFILLYLLLQFSKTMRQAGVRELESVLTQIAKLLKEAKVTFKKNRLITIYIYISCFFAFVVG